jgi:hypothetical protein
VNSVAKDVHYGVTCVPEFSSYRRRWPWLRRARRFPQIGRLVQPVRFEADERGSEVRLLAPRSGDPLGAAGIRLWTRVTNPNGFGLTLSTLRATLLLENTRAATGDFRWDFRSRRARNRSFRSI